MYRPSLSPGNRQSGSAPGAVGWNWLVLPAHAGPFLVELDQREQPGRQAVRAANGGQGNASGATENHVIAAFVNDNPTNSYLTVLLARSLLPLSRSDGAESTIRLNLSDGNWHTMEVLFGPESSPGAGNGTYQAWVDGTDRQIRDVLWLASGNKPGWPYLIFDPVYGGTKSSPPSTMYWDVDQIYVSTR